MLTREEQSIRTHSQRFASSNLTSRASLNIVAIVLDFLARLAVGFFTNPYLVRLLGDYLYGAWQVLARLTSYTSVMSGRPSIALRWTITSLQSSDDTLEKKRNVGSAILVWLILLPLLSIAGGVIVWLAPDLLKSPQQYISEIRLAVALLVFGVIAQGVTEIPRAVLQGENMEYRRMGVSALIVLAGGGLTLLALYLGMGLAGVALVYSLMFIFHGLLFIQVARRFIPWFGVKMPSMTDVKKFFSLNWWYVGWQILILLLISSDVVLLGFLLTPEQVSIYSISKYAPDLAINMTIIVNAGILPGLGKIISTGDFQRAIRIRSELLALIWSFGLAIMGTTLMWNRSFIALWVGEKYYMGIIPLILVAIKTIQLALIIGDGGIIDLTLNLRKKVTYAIVSLTMSFTSAAILVKGFNLGFTGLGVGYILGQAILSGVYPRIVANFFNMEPLTPVTPKQRPFVIGAMLLTISAFGGEHLRASNWGVFFLASGVTFFLLSLCVYQFALAPDLREQIRSRIYQLTAIETSDLND